MRIAFALLLALFAAEILYAQPAHKETQALRTPKAPRIDGVLNETEWQSVVPAVDFVQRIPYNGRPSRFSTEVRFLYDNTALYVGAILHDPHPDSILMQQGLRDARGLNADLFLFVVSPYNDGLNAFCFGVSASDVQSDFKLSPEAEDFSWDAVWYSKARKTAEGWSVEMKIPYSAIRFPDQEEQAWGINCQREIRRFREVATWNLVDSKVSGYVNQSGILRGIRGINPPLRLSLSPYVSGYLQNAAGDDSYDKSYNVGADLKYGLSQSFTLDMTLVPDFGQVKSDDKVYNFSPFEIQYNEKRQFFTEGTELFSKGNIFYTRRIGSEPKNAGSVSDQLAPHETVTENPTQTRLINASKISGRTAKGLGMGFFNAMSSNTWATVTDTLTGEARRILTQGFTNYNMIVLNQNLPNNSYIDFLNTNYFMPTEGYTANVTGAAFRLANRKYTYALSGEGFVSQKYQSHGSPDFGGHYWLNIAKLKGNFRFDISQLLETERYDPNDMGFRPRNNRFTNELSAQYNIYDPFWKLLNWHNYLYISYNTRYEGLKYTSLEVYLESNTTTRKQLSVGLNAEIIPIPMHDYYEPRVKGRMFVAPAYASLSHWISSDYSKKLAIDARLTGLLVPEYEGSGYAFMLSPRWRISDRWFLRYQFLIEKLLNDVGYADRETDSLGITSVYFGRRDRQVVTNVIESNFIIMSGMSIDLRARHYWLTAPYFEFYQLNDNGSLRRSDYSGNHDINFNLFNLDLSYTWNFAPGSQLSVVWKNMINREEDTIEPRFFRNFRDMIASPAANSFSIRLLFYLDALYLTRKKTG